MSKTEAPAAPSMIIPSGTKIEVDQHGQLSIRAPGNLVLQNSGQYGTLEAVDGSIRIEAGVDVEAVHVRCSDVCFVQGSLTAWKVEARSIELDENARAHVILQETETLHIGREARMVGNFGSESEMFLLFSKFARQLRQLSFNRDAVEGAERPVLPLTPEAYTSESPTAELLTSESAVSPESLLPGDQPAQGPAADSQQGQSGEAGSSQPPSADAANEGEEEPSAVETAEVRAAASGAAEDAAPDSTAASGNGPKRRGGKERLPLPNAVELPEKLFYSLVLLEREAMREGLPDGDRDAIEELAELLKAREMDAVEKVAGDLIERIQRPGEDLLRAQALLSEHLEEQTRVVTKKRSAKR